jgi:hypothetical protein
VGEVDRRLVCSRCMTGSLSVIDEPLRMCGSRS